MICFMPTKKSYSLITKEKCGVLRHTMHWIIPLHFSREIAHGSSHRPPDVAVSRRRGRAQKWQKKLSNPPRPGFQMTKTHATRCARQGQGSHGARDQPRLHLPTPPGPSAARRVQARKHKHPGGQASRSGPGHPSLPPASCRRRRRRRRRPSTLSRTTALPLSRSIR